MNDALGQGFDVSGQPALQYGVQGGPMQTSLNSTPGQVTGFDQGQGVQGQVAGAGNINTGFNAGGQVQTGIGSGGQIQNSFNQGQAVQGQVNAGDFGAERNRMTDAVYQQYRDRLDPYWNTREDQLRNRLSNQGISQNNNTYGNAMQGEARGRNDAYGQALYQAVQAGANEANTGYQQALASGQFANQAAGQQYAQGLGAANFNNQATQQGLNSNLAQGQFANQAQAQQFGQNQAQAQFGNDAQAQQYGQNAQSMQLANQAAAQQYVQNQGAADFQNQANQTTFNQNLAGQQFANDAQNQGFNQQLQGAAQQNAARGQGIQEQAYAQNLPLNQFNSLMSSSQVQAPQGIGYAPTQVGQTDTLGAYALSQQQQNANYQAQMQQQNGILGGLFSLGSAGIGLLPPISDIRLKRDISLVGKLGAHNLYRFKYVWGPEEYVGVMAQEVAHIPGAVFSIGGGFLGVNYGAL